MTSILKIKLEPNLHMKPPIIGYLGSIPENSFSYKYYRLRHPGGIFNTQFGSAVSSLYDVVKDVNKISQSRDEDEGNLEELQKKFTLALFHFTNYIHAAYEIILGCCKEEDGLPEKEIWSWLKEKGYTAGIDYYNKLSELRIILDTFNELKHSSTRLGAIEMKTADQTKVVGYYVASVDVDGAIGPNENLHPEFMGMHTATSFNLRIHTMYYGLYKAADSLQTALRTHFREVYEMELNFNEKRIEKDSVAKKLFDEITKLNKFILPNEKNEKIPIPRIVRHGKEQFLIFEKMCMQMPKSTMQFALNLPLADGFSRSWKVLYTKGLN